MKTLYKIETDFEDIIAELEELCANEDATPEQIEDMNKRLEISQAELQEKAERYAAVIGLKKARAAYLKSEAKRLTAMARVEENSSEVLKDRISHAMKTHGIEKAETDHYKLGWRKSTRVNVSAPPELLPEAYQRITIAADKTAIKNALISGETVDGAELVETKNLSIR